MREMVALTGFMGTGKTTVGRALASLLGWSFFDLDCEIERRQKLAVRELFQLHGEAAFREVETATMRSVLQHATDPAVLALGGGTFVEPENAKLLQSHGARVVFLETPMEQLLQRCEVSDQISPHNPRPLAATPAAFRALYVERLPFYRKADLTVNTTGKAAEDLTQEIIRGLHLFPD